MYSFTEITKLIIETEVKMISPTDKKNTGIVIILSTNQIGLKKYLLKGEN
jgi:hypothetical protein